MRKDPFDERAYLALNLDVAAAVRRGDFSSGHQHWIRHGREEGRLASASTEGFDEAAYMARYPDILHAYREGGLRSGLEHWVKHGHGEGRQSLYTPAKVGEFDAGRYASLNPDIEWAIREGYFHSAEHHWQATGRFEGRPGAPAVAKPSSSNGGWKLQPEGATLFGFASAISGLGTAARGYVDALSASGLPVSVVEVPAWTTPERTQPIHTHKARFRTNLIHQNAEMMPFWLARYADAVMPGRYNIALWVWELHAAYATAFGASQWLDEIWVPSTFVAQSLANVSAAPVHVIPYVVEPGTPAPLGRLHFGIPADAFTFLYAFDLSSGFNRKNPIALLHAFRSAFPHDPKHHLIVKYTQPEHDPASANLIDAIAADSPNIQVITSKLPEPEMLALYANTDCFVSPHRSEGFGLGIATAMYLGKPAIATGYSGNLEFMNRANSFLVDYTLVRVGPGSPPYLPDYVWADPDIAHLSAVLRQVAANRDGTSAIAAAGQADIRKGFGAESIGRAMRTRLAEAEREA